MIYPKSSLTSGGLWRPTPFLPPLFSLFAGATYITHRGPPSTVSLQQGRGAVSWLTSGAKAEGPQGSGPAPGDLSPPAPPRWPLRPGRKRRSRAPRQTPAGAPPHTGAASPAAPREAGRRSPPPSPPPPVFEVEIPGPTQQWRSRKLAPQLSSGAPGWLSRRACNS